jgi:hypothetical protein
MGRNDAAINLALDLLRGRASIDVAMIGSGIFEPLTTAASRRLPTGVSITAYDNSPFVCSFLESLLKDTLPPKTLDPSFAPHSPKVNSRVIDSVILAQYLMSVGVDPDLMPCTEKGFLITERVRSKLRIQCCDVKQVVREWQANGDQWDAIICINVLPNVSVTSGPGTVRALLSKLEKSLRTGGVALIGTICSHFYESKRHPKGLEHFAGEIFRCIHNSPWTLLGLIDRAFLREKLEGVDIMDGYTYLFLGKETADFSAHLAYGNLSAPQVIPSSLIEITTLREDKIWQHSRERHLLAGLRCGTEFKVVQVHSCFPGSLDRIFATTDSTELSLGLCEKILIPL